MLLVLLTTLMQIHFLPAEPKRSATVKRNGLHAKGVRIEINGRTNIRNCQNEMVKVIDGECHADQITLPQASRENIRRNALFPPKPED